MHRSGTPFPTFLPSPENGAWNSVRSGWQQLYGDFERLGVSVELHEFQSGELLDWGRSFHPESVEICLNVAGEGQIAHGRQRLSLTEECAGFYITGNQSLEAQRSPDRAHRFVTLEYSRSFVTAQLAGTEHGIDPLVGTSLLGGRMRNAVSPARHFGPNEQALVKSFCQPPVTPAALTLWYQSKVLEAAAHFFFTPQPDLFCTRQKRLAMDRVQRVCALLQARLEAPPRLEELGLEVGVSQFYLSRIFSEGMGMTIPQYLRRIRMERASELLLQGGHNVTEAAFAVGYSSLGHFSKSFCEVIGCCPTLFPHARLLASTRPQRPTMARPG